ncbi:MAG: hypothetical protein IPJ17_12925 [Holophagales bacterium]|nr:MAG: hypothetical protein IPJ17_12925 [Holophagales bacterium]
MTTNMHLYLPALDEKKGVNVASVARAALWSNNSAGVLKAISAGLLVSDEAKSRGLSSVPDIWARPLTFQAALRRDSKHPLRAELIQEWRGLLSLLALSKLHKEEVAIVPVRTDDGLFSKALRRLSPRPIELEPRRPYRWEDVFLICYRPAQAREREIPLGALSPATLVYTGAGYAEQLRQYPSLFHREGVLRPPDGGEDREYLAKWVRELEHRLRPLASQDEAIADINSLVKAWLEDLGGGASLSATLPVEVSQYHLGADTALGLRDYGIYREVLRPLEAGEDTGASPSDVLLRTGRNRTKHPFIVVISSQTLGRDVKVWRTKRSTHLGAVADPEGAIARHFTADKGSVIDREDLGDAIWIRPEKFFLTDTLIAAKGGGAFLPESEAAGNKDAKFVLPFRKEILDFFAPRSLIEVLRPEYSATEAGVVFSFRLPVWDGKVAESVEVRKLYKYKAPMEGEGRIREVMPPVLYLFPQYLGPDWRRYYLFQHGLADLVASPLAGAPSVLLDERERGETRTVQMMGDDPFPEAVDLELQDSAQGRASAGVVLLLRTDDAASQRRGGQLHVGIDFGTSNTNIYRLDAADGGAMAEQWSFDFPSHLRSLSTGGAAASEVLLREFVPNEKVELPIATTLRLLSLASRDHLFLDYFAFFPRKDPPEFQLPNEVHGDIKWNETDRKTDLFLESILFLILLEVARERPSTCQLLCSYPKAFSPLMIGLFREDWSRVRQRLLEDQTTRVLNVKQGAADAGRTEFRDISFGIEGQAAGHFFASDRIIANRSDRAEIQLAALCLDVGGGTTDISLWFRNRIALDASIKLAGRQVSDLIQRNHALRELLFSQTAAVALGEKNLSSSKFAARLNLVLRQNEALIREGLIRHANRPEVMWLRRTLAVEFAAIVFYSASLLASTDAAQSCGAKGELLRQIGRDNLKMHWGGNAARLISWIDFGRFSEEGSAAQLFKAMLINALDDAGAILDEALLFQKQSPRYKSEVAGGLVVMDQSSARQEQGPRPATLRVPPGGSGAQSAAGLVLGEDCEDLHGAVSWFEAVSPARFFPEAGGTTFQNTTMRRFDRFLEIVNYCGVALGLFSEDAKVTLSPSQRALIEGEIRGEFIIESGKPPAKREVEPVFISEVKTLLQLLGESFEQTGR